MLPPMNPYSMAATIVSMPLIRPRAVVTASFMPVAAIAGFEALAVRLRVGELQRIDRGQAGVELFPVAVEERPQAFEPR